MAKTMVVEFKGVGRDRQSWRDVVPSFEDEHKLERAMLKSIRSRSALASREVEFEYDEDTNTGKVIVGGFRCVGHFCFLTE